MKVIETELVNYATAELVNCILLKRSDLVNDCWNFKMKLLEYGLLMDFIVAGKINIKSVIRSCTV